MQPVLSLLALCLADRGQESRPTVSFERVVMIGASVTHGGAPAAAILEAALRQQHEEIERIGHPNIALDPVGIGREQMERAVRHEATVVFGIDLFFWYAYGRPYLRDRPDPKDPEAWRVARVEQGLRDLDRVRTPIVLGEIPDMRGASEWLLPPYVIPSPATLAKINETVRAWARQRPRVLLLPLCDWVSDMRAGRLGMPPAVDPKAAPLAAEVIMSGDRLHPSGAGHVLLGSWIVVKLEQWLGEQARDKLALPVERVLEEFARHLPAKAPPARR